MSSHFWGGCSQLFCPKFSLQRSCNSCEKAFPEQLLQREIPASLPCVPENGSSGCRPHPQLVKLSTTSFPAEDNSLIYTTNKSSLLLLFYFSFRGSAYGYRNIFVSVYNTHSFNLQAPVYAHTFKFMCACNINSKSSVQMQLLGNILLYT